MKKNKCFPFFLNWIKNHQKVLWCVCFMILFLNWVVPRTQLIYLCSTRDEPIIYKQASGAGYYDDIERCTSAISLLVAGDYQFIECHTDGARFYEPISEEGYYRITKVLRSSGLCHEGADKQMRKYIGRFRNFLEAGMCLSITPLEKTEARYGLYYGNWSIRPAYNLFGGKIQTRHSVIKDHQIGDLVAESYTFDLFPMPNFSLSSFNTMEGCNRYKSYEAALANPGVQSVNLFVTPSPSMKGEL